MGRSNPLWPVYDFSSIPSSISLLKGDIEMGEGDSVFTGHGQLILQFLPSSRLTLRANVHGEMTSFMAFFALKESKDLWLSFRGQGIKGFYGNSRADSQNLELDWIPQTEPVTLSNMRPKTTASAIMHLFNFPNFRGGLFQELLGPVGRALLVLESEEWTISVQELPDEKTQDAWGKIRSEGGSFLTHVVKLERKDGKLFSGEDAKEQRFLLSTFLSFLRGGRCSTICEVGFDAAGEKTWEMFAHPYVSDPPYSWFNPFQASQPELLFPLFSKRWQQSEEWQDCLRIAIHWYTQANTRGVSLSIEAGIILAQSALERLAHHHLVADKKMISAERLDRLKTSDRLRLFFTSLSLPIEISDVMPDLQRSASRFRWIDAPHAITDIRNELVHPVSRKQVTDCFFDAWRLSLWYLELSILAMCGYEGTYTSRLTAEYVTDSDSVPWKKSQLNMRKVYMYR